MSQIEKTSQPLIYQSPVSTSSGERSKEKGSAIHEIFNTDTLESFSSSSTPKEKLEKAQLSLWEWLLSWFKNGEKQPINDSETSISETIINPIPQLEAPRSKLEIDVIETKKKVEKISMRDIEEITSQITKESMEAILFIIFKHHLELQKENANVVEKTYSKYREFQKYQQELLSQIKDVLIKDQVTGKYFETAQNAALLSNIAAGLISGAVAFQYLNPAWGVASTLTSGFLTASTLGAKSYFQYLMNEHKGDHEEFTHKDQYFNQRTDDSRDRLIETIEKDNAYSEGWIRHLRRSNKMREAVLN